MTEAVEKLIPVLATLTAEDRAALRHYLRELDGDEPELTEEEWEAEWAEEIDRRIADHKSGKTVGIPHEEVMRQMKEKYG